MQSACYPDRHPKPGQHAKGIPTPNRSRRNQQAKMAQEASQGGAPPKCNLAQGCASQQGFLGFVLQRSCSSGLKSGGLDSPASMQAEAKIDSAWLQDFVWS